MEKEFLGALSLDLSVAQRDQTRAEPVLGGV